MHQKKLQVGSDIKYYCSRCQLELGHRILAMVNNQPARVRCNTCFSERNYRIVKEKPANNPLRRPSRKISAPDFYQKKVQESLMKSPKAYRVDISAEEGDVIDHKTFGRGVVLKVIPPDRMEILFQDQSRTLICKLQ